MAEELKKAFEQLTGMGCPKRGELTLRDAPPEILHFGETGGTPNNPRLPLLIYRQVLTLKDGFDPAAGFEVLFSSNRWKDSWRDSMYGFNHFHTGTHEVLGLARGRLSALFGGAKVIELAAGDVVVIPAGVGHQCLKASPDLLIVGAYPPNGEYDEPRPGEIPHDEALSRIKSVPFPAADPVYGKDGPLLTVWTAI